MHHNGVPWNSSSWGTNVHGLLIFFLVREDNSLRVTDLLH